MSLIPSESYSFPEEFTQTIRPARKPRRETSVRQAKPEARKRTSFPLVEQPGPLQPNSLPPIATPESPRGKSSPPLAQPQEPQNLTPVVSSPITVVPNGTSQVQPSLANEGNANGNTVASVSLAEFMRILQASAQTVEVEPPAPSPPVAPPLDEELDFELFQQDAEQVPEKRRRRAKFRRFIVCEAVVVAILIPLASVGLSRTFTDPTLVMLVNILTITAAVLAALIPIMFFAISPQLPRDESINRI